MWDYDKLFAEGNIVGIKNNKTNKIYIDSIDTKSDKEFYIEDYGVDTLDYSPSNEQIQYIIRLDEHGNVVEKLFDREKDMPKPMPELETGMFVVVRHGESKHLGYVDVEHNKIIYQSGGWDEIYGKYGVTSCSCVKILSIYDKKASCFDGCRADNILWRETESNYFNS